MEIDLDSLQQAIACQFNPSADSAVKKQAFEYCNFVKNHSEGWKRCLECLFQTDDVNLKFFCLQTMEEKIGSNYESITNEERQQLRAGLIAWICDHIPSHPQEEPAVKNKFAQILTMMLRVEYPTMWPDFFHQLFRLLGDDEARQADDAALVLSNGIVIGQQQVTRIDMLLRVISAIDTELVAPRDSSRPPALVKRVADIKDAMRDDCVPLIVELCYGVIVSYSRGAADAWPGAALLVDAALNVLQCYVSWVDIELVIAPERVEILKDMLRHPRHRCEACNCIAEIVAKGMPPREKLSLVSRLNLKSVVLDVLNDLTIGDSPHGAIRKSGAVRDETFLSGLGAIVARMGVELCQSYDALRIEAAKSNAAGNAQQHEQSAKEALEDLLQLLFQFLASPDINVSTSVFPFVGEYLQKLRRTPGALSPARQEHCRVLMRVACSRMSYPPEHDHDNPDEPEEQFEDYRLSLDQYVRAAGKMQPEALSELVDASVAAVTPDASENTPSSACASLPAADVEFSLHMLYAMFEGTDAGVRQAFEQRGLPTTAMARLLATGVMQHPHRVVRGAFFDCVVRHARCLPSISLFGNSAVLTVLQALLGESGIGAEHSAVRQRAASAFVRVARSLRCELLPHAHALLQACAESMSITLDGERRLAFADQLSLFEAIGVVLSQTADNTEAADAVIQSLCAGLNNILQNNDNNLTPDVASTLLAQHINAIAMFSKGFSLRRGLDSASRRSRRNSTGSSSDSESDVPRDITAIEAAYSPIFQNALGAVLEARRVAAGSEEVRSAVTSSLHMIVNTLGAALPDHLPAIFETCAIEASPRDLVDFTRLLSQLIVTFGEQMRAPLASLLSGLLSGLMRGYEEGMAAAGGDGAVGGVRSELRREVEELRRAIYSLVYSVASSGCTDVLLADSLQAVFPLLLEGIEADDTNIQKAACSTILILMKAWIGSVAAPGAAGSDDGLSAFVYGQSVGAGARAVLANAVQRKSSGAPLDATFAGAVQDIGALHQLLLQAHGLAAINEIGRQLVGVGVPEEMVSEYCTALAPLANGSARDVRRLLITFADAFAEAQQ